MKNSLPITIKSWNSSNDEKKVIEITNPESIMKITTFLEKMSEAKQILINKIEKNEKMTPKIGDKGKIVTPDFKVEYKIGNQNKKGENMYSCIITESNVVLHPKIATPLIFSIPGKSSESKMDVMNKIIKKAKAMIDIAFETSKEIESGKIKL